MTLQARIRNEQPHVARRKFQLCALLRRGLAGLGLTFLGLLALAAAFVPAYGSADWDKMLFGIGMPGTLALVGGGICTTLICAWLVLGAFTSGSD